MTTQLQEKLNILVRQKKLLDETADEILREVRDPWMQSQGLLRKKKINPVQYQKKMRKELDRSK